MLFRFREPESGKIENMDLQKLRHVEAWDWPAEAGDLILKALNDEKRPLEERLLAVELSGELADFGPVHGAALLNIVEDNLAPEQLRARAAIALGPALELADIDGFDCEFEEPALTPELFEKIKKALRKVIMNLEAPKELRRRALEAAVRAPENWQRPVARQFFEEDDRDWKLTAVFCMRFLKGFERDIVEALKTSDELILIEALQAAANWELRSAWPDVRKLLRDRKTPRDVLLVAVEAAYDVGGSQAQETLQDLSDHPDEDVAALAEFSLADGLDSDDFDD